MSRLAWALLITSGVLFGLVAIVHAIGAPLTILGLAAVFGLALKARNSYVGHQASGLDADNQPGRAVTVANRTSRWWDAEAEMEHGHRAWLTKLIQFKEIRIGSLDKARRQQAAQRAGKPVRPIDWTSPNRNGGGMGMGGMTASGMTYDWCTCSEQAMPLLDMPDGSQRVNVGEQTCLCQCCECAPKGSYLDEDGKRQPVRPRHWRVREMEHEVAVNLAVGHEYERRFSVRWGRRYDAAVALIEDIRKDRRDRKLAQEIGYVDTQVRRDRGEEVITDTDEWHYRRGTYDPADEETPGRHASDRDTDPIDPRPGGHE